MATQAEPASSTSAAASSGRAGGPAARSTTRARQSIRALPANPDGAALTWEGEDGDVRRLTNAELTQRGRPRGRHVRPTGRRRGRPSRHLPAAAPRDGHIRTGDWQAEGDLHPHLLRLRGPCGCEQARTTPVPPCLSRPTERYRRGAQGAHEGDRRTTAVAQSAERENPARGRASEPASAPQEGWVRRSGPLVVGRDGCDPGSGPARRPPETDPETPYMIIYTSGTTGRPKGAVHVHGGFPIKGAQDLAHCFDLGPGDRLFWFTDLGWMMGPWAISGALLLGAELVLYEGAPDYPAPDRLWALVARHGVTHLGLSPTVIRALMAHGTEPLHEPRPVLAARARLDRRAVEPRVLVVVLQQRRRRPAAAHQLQRRHRGQRRHRLVQPDDADQADFVRRPERRRGRGRHRRCTATPSAARSASSSCASLCRA